MGDLRKRAAREIYARRSTCVRIGFWLMVSALLIRGAARAASSVSWAVEARSAGGASTGDERGSTESQTGTKIVQHGGYPELRVDGKPFFIHAAAFFYYRMPRDLWEPMLESYRRLGINTLDIYIPWNWHEPKEGEFDFDGHTNSRRDLRRLLSLVSEKGFRLIARPGPEILNEWRYGGYPAWLLERPEYKMDPLDWMEGRYAPLDNLNARDAEAAARGWLDNRTHMEQVRAWMTAVAKELAPYSSHALLHVNREAQPHEASGPLLFVQLGDDFAIGRTNRVGSYFWRYVEELRGMLSSGGLDVPAFINPTDMRVSAEGSQQNPAIGVMGQWYMRPGHSPSTENGRPALTARDASEIEFFAEELKTQPDFPPVMIEYQAGWYAPGDDDRPPPNRPENTLLGSRLLIGNGIHGFNYFPLQDTYTPAGYSVPWANRSYRWDAPLGPDGDPQPRIEAVRRNAQLLEAWGPRLAASHKRADFGIIYPLGAYDQSVLTPTDVRQVSEAVMRIERLADLATLSSELLDPEFQPVEQLLRDPLVMLPVFDPDKPQFQLSKRAQQRIVEYVERGGTLVVFPARPAGTIIHELWTKGSPESAAPSAQAKWKFGNGEVLESAKDFYSWISLDQSLGENREQKEFTPASNVLSGLLSAAGIEPAIIVSKRGDGANELIASEIVTNEATEVLGNGQRGQGFLSVTNLSADAPADATLRVLSPSAPARGSRREYASIDVVVPAHDSLLLPLEIPLCAGNVQGPDCTSSIANAGAEFLEARREGKVLEVAFYVPSRADIHLRLPERPSRVSLDDSDIHPTSNWTASASELKLTIPRGAAPGFRRTLKLDLPHAQQVPKEKSNRLSKAPPEDLNCYVANAVRFPTSGNAFLRTYPALIVPGADQKLNVLLMAENRNETASGYVTLSFDKPLHGTKTLVVPARGNASELIEFRPADLGPGVPAASDRLFHTAIEVHTGRDRRVLPVVFLLHANEPEDRYRFDFDRDGADEWVLENDRLRLIVSPESGGRAVVLMDKDSALNLSTSVGLLRDGFSFTENPPGITDARKRGRYGLANRPYVAEWGGDRAHPVLKLDYDAPDVFPQGASIDKVVQFENAETITVDYKIELRAKKGGRANSPPQSFVAMNSFPAEARDGTATRFCWRNQTAAQSAAIGDEGSAKSSIGEGPQNETCEEFHREGQPIVVPQGLSAVEIHRGDGPDIQIAWDCIGRCGQMSIEPKYFSALFRLEFPPLLPGTQASYRMYIRVVNGP
jgi:Glycosyl hydrolases family 35